jgi:lipopolysaccharide/colanic/teichoic acid biosynthesis glycosyltransferase
VWRFVRSQRPGLAARLNRLQARLEIDRWPELWSVVTGDLALVGAKPVTVDSAAPAEQAADGGGLSHRDRPGCDPGFTGLWYVQCGPGADEDEIRIADAYYAATRSWREDWRILAQTPAAWARRVRQEDLR